MEEEVIVSWACRASSSCAVCRNEYLARTNELGGTYLRARRGTHIDYLDACNEEILS